MAYGMNFGRRRGFTLGPLGFLIISNIIVWIATSIRPDLFISWLGLYQAGFASRLWTIVTHMFVHLPFPSFGHILANMFTLYFFGSFLIRLLGEKAFFTIYLAGGLLGGAFYLLFGHPYIPAIGASGAVFSVAGALTVLRPKSRVFIFPFPVPIPLWIAVLGGFLVMSFIPGVSWEGHLGGLLFGLGAGYYFRRKPRIYL